VIVENAVPPLSWAVPQLSVAQRPLIEASTTGTGGDGSSGTVPYTLQFVLGPNLVSASIEGGSAVLKPVDFR